LNNNTVVTTVRMLPKLYNEEEDRKMNISRRVAEELFNKNYISSNVEDERITKLEKLLYSENHNNEWKVRTLKIIADPRSTHIYSMKKELRFVTGKLRYVFLFQIL